MFVQRYQLQRQSNLSEFSPTKNVLFPSFLSTRLLWFIIASVINEGRQSYRAHHALHAFIELLIEPRGRARQVIHARLVHNGLYRVCRGSRAHFLPIWANIVGHKFINEIEKKNWNKTRKNVYVLYICAIYIKKIYVQPTLPIQHKTLL